MNPSASAEGVGSPVLSVVVPLYNEQENIPGLYRRLTDALGTLGLAYELVLVNDGSRDATAALLDALAASDARVVGVHLSRNFGHQPAVCAGLEHARGRAVVVMDGDLQDPPEILGRLVERWRGGHEVVYAVRTRRKEGPLKQAGYFAFYRLLRAVSDLDIPLDSGDFCLMDRKVVDALNALPERMRFVRGLRAFVGFRQTGVTYERDARAAGEPKYSLRALLRLALDGLISFSGLPLKLLGYVSVFSMVLVAVLAAWLLGQDGAAAPPGWTVATIAVLVLCTFQLMGQAILGAYVRRIFLEVKGRPTYIVREVSRGGAARSAAHGETYPGAPTRREAA